VSEAFEREVIDRLARIEQNTLHQTTALREHTEEDGTRFEKLEAYVMEMMVSEGIRKKAARATGAMGGTGAGAAVWGLLEIASRVWGS
jgi:hypothetical protein